MLNEVYIKVGDRTENCRTILYQYSTEVNLYCYFSRTTDKLLSVDADISIERHCFVSMLDHNICSVALYFSISLDSKVPANSSFFLLLFLVLVSIHTNFHNPIFNCVYVLPNECYVLCIMPF